MTNNTHNSKEENSLRTIGEFDIKPYDISKLRDSSNFFKLESNDSQKAQISNFVGQIPNISGTIALSNAYVVKFPEGVPHTLMQYKDGGNGSAIVGSGGIIDHASFHQIGATALVLTALGTMSFVSGQYFLKQVNDKLNTINMNIEKIFEFLHDDKKAELESEIQFIGNAFQNYNFIFSNEAQRIATISSIQETIKTAFKNCEFYCGEMKKYTFKKGRSPIENDVEMSLYFEKLTEWSMNLYAVANVLEVYYSNNFETDYLKSTEKTILDNVKKYEKDICEAFIHLKKRVNGTYDKWYWKYKKRGEDFEKIIRVIDSYSKKQKSDLQENIKTSLYLPVNRKEYYISRTGDIYLKVP